MSDELGEANDEYAAEVRELLKELGLPEHLCTRKAFEQVKRSLAGEFHEDKFEPKPGQEGTQTSEPEDKYSLYRSLPIYMTSSNATLKKK
ncbi:uncharacterized protein FOMMEDRAFT_162906 [Fomitiporia mediterranea MF3/22]|uniref:Uncharacterized protein n=1 Tax=Fomitiporia mediterranea (strain MF3/22) TaxID=694068 RepID=R7SGK0_FOMME|nr:uncharacterized protein FOMMEDRAFT_162906 [Fomitiporia mediterranea MF3/22]EJC97550.1 hypothetical protein FOMMEDRAFT_162906 [Fomitiporia mediterranea MF3/22]